MKIGPKKHNPLPRAEFSAATVTSGLSGRISIQLEGGKSLRRRVSKTLPHKSAGKAVTVVLQVFNRSYKTRVAPELNPRRS